MPPATAPTLWHRACLGRNRRRGVAVTKTSQSRGKHGGWQRHGAARRMPRLPMTLPPHKGREYGYPSQPYAAAAAPARGSLHMPRQAPSQLPARSRAAHTCMAAQCTMRARMHARACTPCTAPGGPGRRGGTAPLVMTQGRTECRVHRGATAPEAPPPTSRPSPVSLLRRCSSPAPRPRRRATKVRRGR